METVDEVEQNILEYLRRHNYEKIKRELKAYRDSLLKEIEKEIDKLCEFYKMDDTACAIGTGINLKIKELQEV